MLHFRYLRFTSRSPQWNLDSFLLKRIYIYVWLRRFIPCVVVIAIRVNGIFDNFLIVNAGSLFIETFITIRSAHTHTSKPNNSNNSSGSCLTYIWMLNFYFYFMRIAYTHCHMGEWFYHGTRILIFDLNTYWI